MGIYNLQLFEHEKAIEYLNKSYKLSTDLGFERLIANSLAYLIACNEYLKVLGLVATGHAWIKVLDVSFKDYDKNKKFYEEKIKTADFFFNRVLTKCENYYDTASTGSKYIMDFKFNW